RAYAEWGRAQIVEFLRIHNIVQLIARNETFRATPNSPEAQAVAAAYSPSLLGAVPVASQPAPDSKAGLGEANGLFLADMMGMAIHLQQRFRQNYAMDARNSFFDYVRGSPEEIAFDVTAHYATGTIQGAAPNPPPGTAIPSVPSFLPDVR